MKILKILLYIILALVVIVAVAGILLPKEYDISVSEKLDAPLAMVHHNVVDFTQWERWMPWKEQFPNMEIQLGDPYKGEGASYSWGGGESDAGSMQIDSLVPCKHIKTSINFGPQGKATGHWDFIRKGEQTEVIWGMKTRTSFPQNIMIFLGQGTMKDVFRKGLNNLEAVSKEDQKNGIQYGDFLVTAEDFNSVVLVGVREAGVSMQDLDGFFKDAYGKIYRNLSRNGIKIESPPMAVYYTWDEEKQLTDCAAAVKLEDDLEVAGLDRFRITRARSLRTTVKGSYEQLGAAHDALEQAGKDMGLVAQAPAMEVYQIGPENSESPEDYVTEVIYRYIYPD